MFPVCVRHLFCRDFGRDLSDACSESRTIHVGDFVPVLVSYFQHGGHREECVGWRDGSRSHHCGRRDHVRYALVPCADQGCRSDRQKAFWSPRNDFLQFLLGPATQKNLLATGRVRRPCTRNCSQAKRSCFWRPSKMSACSTPTSERSIKADFHAETRSGLVPTKKRFIVAA